MAGHGAIPTQDKARILSNRGADIYGSLDSSGDVDARCGDFRTLTASNRRNSQSSAIYRVAGIHNVCAGMVQ